MEYDGRKDLTGSERDLLEQSETIYGVYFSKAKLKAIAQTSALLAGFAMVAMVEVALEPDVKYPPVLLIMFACITTLLVIVHLFSLMIATCVLPNIEAAIAIRKWSSSPHNKFRSQIEVAWILSTGFGLVLFLIEVALLIWIKFWTILEPTEFQTGDSVDQSNSTVVTKMPNHQAAWSAAMIASFAFLVPGGVAFVYFGTNFYRKLADHATRTRGMEMEALMAQDTLFVEQQTDALSGVSGYSFRSATNEIKHI